jgi:uncharacterized FAD-dependent dehydrogenase
LKKKINIELKPEQIHNIELIKTIVARICHLPVENITGINYIKRSLDSRNKKNKYSLSLEVYSGEPFIEKKLIKSKYKETSNKKNVIIIGAGPSGYFSALEFLEYGIKPIIFERGKDVRKRRFDLKTIMQKGIVNPNSNYCFGEGGAGAYSDGKLYTRSNKRGDIKKALQILVEQGASHDIMIDAYPHIGSNKLPKIISNLRDTIIKFGGEINFDSQATDIVIKNNSIKSIVINDNKEIVGDIFIFATGHSARDIYYLFNNKNITLESKPYAVGFRVEHYQELINEIQYGKNYCDILPPASYRLATQANKGVFSFCMCPGGIIVPASTADKELVVNGMSMSARNSKFANSGIVTSVDKNDFDQFTNYGVLSGLKFQEALENSFFTNNNTNLLRAPAQRLIDFVNNRNSSSLMETSYVPGIEINFFKDLFPKRITSDLQKGIISFEKKMKGFLTHEANIIGLESRTSSPIRIPRDKELYSHIEIKNLFPCGEGSGYAGGIISSAMDGQNCAKAIIKHHFNIDTNN